MELEGKPRTISLYTSYSRDRSNVWNHPVNIPHMYIYSGSQRVSTNVIMAGTKVQDSDRKTKGDKKTRKAGSQGGRKRVYSARG